MSPGLQRIYGAMKRRCWRICASVAQRAGDLLVGWVVGEEPAGGVAPLPIMAIPVGRWAIACGSIGASRLDTIVRAGRRLGANVNIQ